MGRTGGISSLKAVLECFERHLDAVVGSFWDIVAGLGGWKRPFRELFGVVRLFGQSW